MQVITIDGLKEQVLGTFDHKILKRGWSYYTDGFVDDFERKGDQCYANVYGSEVYEVKVDLEKLRRSSCDCPFGGYCKHIAAVLFQACEDMGFAPEELLLPSGRKANAPTVHRKQNLLPPQEKGSAAEWRQFFGELLNVGGYRLGQAVTPMFRRTMEQLMQAAAGWQPSVRQVYALHACLFLLDQLDELYRNQIRYSYAYFDLRDQVFEARDEWTQELLSIAEEWTSEQLKGLSRDALEELTDALFEAAFPRASGPVHWGLIYSTFWLHVLSRTKGSEALSAREMSRLDEEASRETASVYRKEMLNHALLLHLVQAGKDQEAMELAEERLGNARAADFFAITDYLVMEEEWERLLLWVRWLQPVAVNASPSQLRTYFGYWEQVKARLPMEEEWKETVLGMLPDSYGYYSDYLLKSEHYQAWVDLNLLLEVQPLSVPNAILKSIESSQRELLLPWYHHSVEALVAEKNRDAYKRAVRVLRKLQPIYKRLKRQDRWEAYIGYLVKRYARLRAFQEELRKLRKGAEAG
ncbi:SWIM zinc finger family protein [Paenibacillus filicis]|uniref:SWIM zinc finger family protein n=1 Tax=Paenibacillus gyeongsangnamensis TaxID=3388067 RepID=A0ABT4Q6S8_9BACL|nr:SWIM zinc finger family protein [Paenibacillus filicis]MCZ8512536.1 SWIM zinc finger family protein [Paenibacillus filicis]